MTRPGKTILTLLLLVSAPSGIAQSVDPVEDIKSCTRLTDRDARLACFDDIGERVLGEESVDGNTVRKEVAPREPMTTAPAVTAQPRPAVSGAASPGGGQAERSATFSGMMTSCKKGHFGEWYFVLDNGEIWKEVKKRNRRFEDCNLEVTITKDMFGYNMRIDALDRTIRVKRQK